MSRWRQSACLFVSALMSVALSSCSSDPFAFCSGNSAIASFTLQFSSGLDNFSEDQYTNLQQNTEEVLDVLEEARKSADSDVRKAAEDLLVLVVNFKESMRSDWDISQAISDPQANEAASALATSESLRNANLVESFVIDTCGMPSTVDPALQTGDTLPMPPIPSPTATDPPTNTVKEDSENLTLGTTVANLFGLTLTKTQVACLGLALQGVTDITGKFSSSDVYQSQFQQAFDACSIDFIVPSS